MTDLNSADISYILEALPHRYPFLLVDRVTDIVPDESAVGLKNVTMNEPFFQGHFPNHPIMPGVLIIEAMAQTAAILVCKTLGDDVKGKLVYFMGIDETKFRKPVLPGDQLKMYVQKSNRKGPVWKFNVTAKVEGQLCAESIITAMIMNK